MWGTIREITKRDARSLDYGSSGAKSLRVHGVRF